MQSLPSRLGKNRGALKPSHFGGTMSSINTASNLAREFLLNKKTKTGITLFEHSATIANKIMSSHYRKPIKCFVTAILHEILNDTGCTARLLRENGIDESIIHAIKAMTKKKNEDYDAYIQRVSTNRLATCVKIEDLKEYVNSNSAAPSKYAKALEYLKKIASKKYKETV